MRADIKRFMFKNIGFFLIAVVSALYIVKGLYTLGQSGKSVMEILGDGALSASVGFIIGHLMRQTGISYGEDDTELIRIRSYHARLLDEMTPHIDKLDSFCAEENANTLRTLRGRILSRNGIKYDDVFDAEGLPRNAELRIPDGASAELKRSIRAKRKAIRRAIGIKITPLSPQSLSVDGARNDDPYNFGRTESQYLYSRGWRDIVSKVLFGILFGYYAIYITDSGSTESIVWASLQIGIYLIFGAAQMMQSYMFVKQECTARISRKIDIIGKFLRKCS